MPEIEWLLDQGTEKCILVSCSNIISEDNNNKQPPHFQAANYYKEVAEKKNGIFIVTMEHPKSNDPKPLVITIDKNKATLKNSILVGAMTATTRQAPRAGINS